MKHIDTKQWKEFVIKDLFTVKRPSARSQANYDDGDVPFVASGNFNNGVLKYLEPKKDEILDAGNCITVSPIDGSSFYLGDTNNNVNVVFTYNGSKYRLDMSRAISVGVFTMLSTQELSALQERNTNKKAVL